ncbi:ribonuclease P protein subunit p40-like isoform X2 [Schistocerca serialis cubense]|uniref:ribonuclease P protein subunit p40-like isoform X2 n=1 Tax=Schistocerca serialis cubense TaxID=2023355 RepID=UPI00214ECD0A|nr:ribonuclease P protein subunit p40-like isoform X2 [Schistocerca serialis cubense]
MLSPEIWSFSSPCSKLSSKVLKEEDDAEKSHAIVSSHHFNHMISVVIPDTLSVPSSIVDALLEDCAYYRIFAVPAVELINRNFLDAFVRRGELTLLSHNTRIDVDDSIAVTPNGLLILSLNKGTYQQLGLEGRQSFFQRDSDRYIINLDIKASNFGPGNKNYERVFWCLKNCFNVKFGIVLAWDPPVENICPSSVAAYFDDKGYNVHQCHPHFSKRISYNVPVPPVTARKEDESSEYCDVLEWLGAFSVGVDLNLEPREDFLSTYSVPDGCKLIGQVAYVSWQGFFTKKPILKLLQILRKYTEERRNLCWTSMNVQGFLDSPVTWGLKEQGFFTSGDNHYTLFLKDGAALLACQVNGAQKKYRI